VTAAPVDDARAVGRTSRRLLAGRDLTVAAAELTYFGGIAVVPWLLLACWASGWGGSPDAAEARLAGLVALVPPDMGARPVAASLIHAGTHLGVVGAIAALLPATFYGEGVRRGCLSLAPTADRFTGWRARASLLPVLVVVVPTAWVGARGAAPLADLAARDGFGPHAGRVVLGFTITWLALALPLAWVFRHVAPRRVGWPAALLGGLATASFLAGFLQGFLLFLSIPVDVGIPFGGLQVVGGVVAAGFWLFLLHLVVLTGWVVTLALDSQLRQRRATEAA
jgi:membrane protein